MVGSEAGKAPPSKPYLLYPEEGPGSRFIAPPTHRRPVQREHDAALSHMGKYRTRVHTYKYVHTCLFNVHRCICSRVYVAVKCRARFRFQAGHVCWPSRVCGGQRWLCVICPPAPPAAALAPGPRARAKKKCARCNFPSESSCGKVGEVCCNNVCSQPARRGLSLRGHTSLPAKSVYQYHYYFSFLFFF